MRFRDSIAKLAAIVLLLLFSQKIGVGLYLHNFLHVKSCDQTTLPDQGRSMAKACHCIDDFSVPFDEASVDIVFPAIIHHNSFHSFSFQTVSVSFPETRTSRGPPSQSSEFI